MHSGSQDGPPPPEEVCRHLSADRLTDGPVIVLLVVRVVPASRLLFLLLLLEPEAAERRLRSCRALGSFLLRCVTRPPGC